jgi:hypothetical protein
MRRMQGTYSGFGGNLAQNLYYDTIVGGVVRDGWGGLRSLEDWPEPQFFFLKLCARCRGRS